MERRKSPRTEKTRLSACLEKLDQIEKGFSKAQTLDLLFQNGIITGREVVTAGDFNLITWSHSSDGSFSVGALEKVRNEGKPFPEHVHEQRLWLLCSKGVATLDLIDKRIDLNQGEYTVVEPLTRHVIHSNTSECVILMVTIPADPGLERKHER